MNGAPAPDDDSSLMLADESEMAAVELYCCDWCAFPVRPVGMTEGASLRCVMSDL